MKAYLAGAVLEKMMVLTRAAVGCQKGNRRVRISISEAVGCVFMWNKMPMPPLFASKFKKSQKAESIFGESHSKLRCSAT